MVLAFAKKAEDLAVVDVDRFLEGMV